MTARTCAALLLAAALILVGGSAEAGSLHRLSGAEIRSRLMGNVLTDGAHWSETYERAGKLLVNDVGNVSTGSWRVEADRLCKLRPDILNECYEVWLDGDAVELRHERFAPVAAILQDPRGRSAKDERAARRR